MLMVLLPTLTKGVDVIVNVKSVDSIVAIGPGSRVHVNGHTVDTSLSPTEVLERMAVVRGER